jgi:hypothetical protein
VTTSRDNRMRWDRQGGHYEVWYITLNHRASETGAWIRYTLEAPLSGEPHAELWFAHFDARDPARNVALRRRLPIHELVAEGDPFAVSMGGALLRDDRAHGRLEGAGHQVSWDLAWTKAASTHRHLPPIFYRTLRGREGLGDTTVLSPGLSLAVTGALEVDGRRFELAGEPAGQTHLWGRKHAHAWAWGHATWFADRPGAALETLTARLRKAGRVLPPLTVLSLHLDGEELAFNRLRHLPGNRGQFGTAHYRFAAAAPLCRLEGEFSCRPEDMILAEYEDPDGDPSYCANTEVGDLRVTVFRRDRPLGRWREAAALFAHRTAHFEVAGRERDPAIGNAHIRI